MQCYTAEDRNPEKHVCYTPDMSANRMKTIPAPLNTAIKKTLSALFWHTETEVSTTRWLPSRGTVNEEWYELSDKVTSLYAG